MRLKHFLSVFLTLLTLSVGQMWGASATWALVESAPSDWSGEYLIVYNSNCFDGHLTSGFNGNSGQSVSISNKKITKDDSYAMIVGDKSGTSYSLKTASGYYIGRQSSSQNGVDANQTYTSSNLAVTFGSWNSTNKTVKISGVGGKCLGNNSGSWKFFASSNGYVNVSLYKKEVASGFSITYHCNGATSGCPSDATGQTKLPATLATPAKTGCTFAGWYTNEALTSAATPGATLSANANLYAKWTCNVTLNRNGVVDNSHTNVTTGTTLASLQGEGDQGGCSAWTFIGWSKTQRAAQNNSDAMTLVTTVDGPGPYYAVYKHTEGGGSADVVFNFGYEDWGKNAQFSGDTNDEVSQEDEDITVTYTRNSGSLYANSTSLRFYKSNELTFDAGDKTITAISFTGSVGQTDITTDVNTCTNTSSSLSWEGEATSVTFTRPSNASSYATLTSATVTVGSSTTYYSTTATCCTELAQINGSFNLSHLFGGFWPCFYWAYTQMQDVFNAYNS